MKILYLSIGMASPLNLSLELCRRLVAADHTVTYASHEDIESTVRRHGHDFVRLAAPQNRRASIEDQGLARLLDQLEPERILADIEMHVAILKIARPAAQRGIPLMLTMAFFPVHKAPGRPPLHVLDLPSETFAARLRLEWLWLRSRLETRHMEWRLRLRRLLRLEPATAVDYLCFHIDDLRAVARAHDFPLRRQTSRRQWLRPFMYTRLPVLCFNARQLDWPGEPPSNVHYVGSMVHGAGEASPHPSSSPLPPAVPSAGEEGAGGGAALNELLPEHEARAVPEGQGKVAWEFIPGLGDLDTFLANREDSRPLIYASLGSFWSANLELLRGIVAIFERRPQWDLVLGLGGKLDRSELGDVPSNVLALDWAPQTAVLERADAAVVHGGVATLNECARLSVPMVVYSTGFVEQNGNAARIAFHGLGRLAQSPRHIESSIENVLSDDALRRRRQEVRRELIAQEQRGLAVSMIENAEVVPL